jgi:hypothetical protein
MQEPTESTTQVYQSSEIVTSPALETVVIPKVVSRRPYVIIAIIFIVVILLILVLTIITFITGSLFFSGNYKRARPADQALIPINGDQVTLTAAEKVILNRKIQEAKANIAARQNPPLVP